MYIDFNKENINLAECSTMIRQFLKKSNSLSEDMYYFEDMIDYVTDAVMKREKKYNPEKGSRSTYRYIAFRSSLSTFMSNLKKRKDNVHIGDTSFENLSYDSEMESVIEEDEKTRVYDIAISMIEDRMKNDQRYKCFYDWVVTGIPKKEIAKNLGVTKTCVGQYIEKVRETLKKELINYQGADICQL